MLGEKKANEIEDDPDLFYNLDKFRQWKNKARMNAFFSTLVAVPTITTMLNGGRNGIGLIQRNKTVSGISTLVFFYASLQVFLYKAGFTNDFYLEQSYARNHKMLRNMIIEK